MGQKPSLFKTVNPWVTGTVVVISLGLGVGTLYLGISQLQQRSAKPVPSPTVAPATAVTALGRIEPKGEVIKLSVSNAQDSRVDQLFVEEGDRVKAGQIIAVLQGFTKKQAALAEAEQNVALQQAKLAQIKAGEAKEAEIVAQQAKIAQIEAKLRTETQEKEAAIARAKAELRNAKTTYRRYQILQQQGAESISKLDEKQQNFETAQAKLNEALAQKSNISSTLTEQIRQEKATLEKLKEVRSQDLQVAQAQVDYAKTQVTQAKADLDDLYVRVPVAGQILKINTRIGEQVNTSQGIVELGRTEQMYAIAEVYETDVGKVKLGQRATIVSENGGFPGQLQGTVDHIGLQIKKKNILDSDPAAEKDARVVEVNIKIDPQDSPKVIGFTNLQVRIRIDLTSSNSENRPN
jgi:HlyD family secretion protein